MDFIWCKRVERHRPDRKGLRQSTRFSCFSYICRKTSPWSKGIETPVKRSTLPVFICRKTSPWSKGIETHPFFPWYQERYRSKDIALIERDWDKTERFHAFTRSSSKDIALIERDWDCPFSTLMHRTLSVERHRPDRKGLRLHFNFLCWVLVCRKTSPWSKGIETELSCYG